MSGQTSTTTLSRKARGRWEAPLARNLVYQFLSQAYLYPWAPHREELLGQLGKVEASLAYLGCPDCPEHLASLASALRGHSPQELEERYVAAFGHIISVECPPYEIQYGQGDIFTKSHELADIAGFYRAFGLETSPQVKERPDHISVELGFMGFLALKEAYALEQGHGPDKVRLCRQAQRGFLEKHLASWAPTFTHLLERKAGEGLYVHLASLTRSFLAWEVQAAGAKPRPSFLAPAAPPPQGDGEVGCPATVEDCGGCES